MKCQNSNCAIPSSTANESTSSDSVKSTAVNSPSQTTNAEHTLATPKITDLQGKVGLSATFCGHNYYLCKGDCCLVSSLDIFQLGKAKFSHCWLSTRELTFDKTSVLWQLVYEENKGIFCVLCHKNNLKNTHNMSGMYNHQPDFAVKLFKIILQPVNTKMLLKLKCCSKSPLFKIKWIRRR